MGEVCIPAIMSAPLCTEQLVLKDPLLSEGGDKYFLSTEESFDRIVEKSVRYIRIKSKMQEDTLKGQVGEDRQFVLRM